MRGWLKLYNSIIDDPKIRAISPCDRWHFIAVLVLKNNGTLDEPDDLRDELIGISLGLQIDEVESLKKRLVRYRLVDEEWQPVNWDKLQTTNDPTGAERQRRFRENQAKSKTIASNAVSDALRNGDRPLPEVEVEVEEEIKERQKRKRFVPPTLEEVSARCREMGYGIDPDRFWNFYESQGWKVGKNPMRDWHKALAGWQSREGNKTSRKTDFVDDLTDTSWAR